MNMRLLFPVGISEKFPYKKSTAPHSMKSAGAVPKT